MLSDRCMSVVSCLSVCLSCLSVTLVYCSQTIGWNRDETWHGIGLGPRHIVLEGSHSYQHKNYHRACARCTEPRPISVVAKRSPISTTAEYLLRCLPSCLWMRLEASFLLCAHRGVQCDPVAELHCLQTQKQRCTSWPNVDIHVFKQVVNLIWQQNKTVL